uniref:Cxcl9 protein n=1 Tax=Larimichthys crocea TaxID=215358 RepID=A0A0P0BW67_LARCR|nr:cxcl9 protein [Larimichthys crocea]
MKLYLQSVGQLAFLSLCYVLIIVSQSDSTFVPGRCLCPEAQQGVRGQLKDFTVYPKSPRCHKVTVIVILKSNNSQVCLDPEGRMGKQLTRCWNKAKKLGRDVKLCLGRRRGKGVQRRRQKSRNQSRSRGQSRNTALTLKS